MPRKIVWKWPARMCWRLGAHGPTLYTPGKTFSSYERLGRIFGKDRANGVYSFQGSDVCEASQTHTTTHNSEDDVEMTETANNEDDSLTRPPPTIASSSEQNQGRQTSAKKKKNSELLGNLVDTVRTAMEGQGKQVQVLANVVSGVNEKVNLSRTLKGLGFTNQEIVQIAIKFTQNPEMKQTFWSLDEEKKDFVHAIMEN